MQCIRCGKETQNLYHCYSADTVGRESVETRHGNMITTTTTTTYNNFKPHEGYVCTQCICNKGRLLKFFVGAVMLLIVGVLLLFAMLSTFESDLWTGLICLVFGASSLYVSIVTFRSAFRGFSKRKTDARLDENFDANFNGSATLIKYEKKKSPRTAFFTTTAYLELVMKDSINNLLQ